MGWICNRCIRIEHDAGKSMVTVPEEVLGKCSYCGVENWVFEVVGDVPAKTIADMPELEVEKPKKRKKREVGESIPEAEAVELAAEIESHADEPSTPYVPLDEEPVKKSLEDMTEDELRARLAELEKK